MKDCDTYVYDQELSDDATKALLSVLMEKEKSPTTKELADKKVLERVQQEVDGFLAQNKGLEDDVNYLMKKAIEAITDTGTLVLEAEEKGSNDPFGWAIDEVVEALKNALIVQRKLRACWFEYRESSFAL